MPAVSSSRNAFTLVEMLTAIAVLAILMVIIFSVMGLAIRLTESTTRGGDSSIEARQVLDRIGEDIAGMLIRPDVDQDYVNSAGNDQMFFYSHTAGYFVGATTAVQQSPVSLVGYRISTSANPSNSPVLQRLAQGLNWSGSNALPFLVFSPTPPLSANQVTAADPGNTIPGVWKSAVTPNDNSNPFWHTMGSQIFRLEICYQLKDGSFTLDAPTPSTPPPLPKGTIPPFAPVPKSINDTVGIVVAIAVLDNKSRAIVPPASWANLVSALPDPKAGDLTAVPVQLMETTWNNVLNTSGFAQSVGIPVAATSQIRVYQRYYPLNVPKSQ